jgi:hypothetical protein
MNRAMTMDQRAETTCRAGDGPAEAVWRHDDARALLAALPPAPVDAGYHISPNEGYLRVTRVGFRNLCVPRRSRGRTRVPGAGSRRRLPPPERLSRASLFDLIG